jgi:hypothetical protein
MQDSRLSHARKRGSFFFALNEWRTFVGWGGRPKGEPTKVDRFPQKSTILNNELKQRATP